MSKRILVVDDDKEIVRLVRAYLEQAGYQVLIAHDGESALHVIRRERPDLVVLDLMLPDRDGWDITHIIRRDSTLSPTPIIMLTARVEDADRIAGLEIGADDYVPKPFNPRELVARVKAVLRRAGGQTAQAHVLQIDDLLLDIDQHEARLGQQLIELTPTEFNLLQALMENPGHAFTRLELIEKALGYAYEGMERTLDSHVKNLRKKIEPDPSDPAYIQTVFGVGYRIKANS